MANPHGDQARDTPPAGGGASEHPAPRRLFRYPDHGPLGGVCAGLGDYFSVDATIVRLATVAVALAGPGVILYGVAWIFVPAASPGSAQPRTGRGGNDTGLPILGIILLVVAVTALWGDWWLPGDGYVLPLGLIALGVWLLLRRDAPRQDDGPGGERAWTGAAAAPGETTASVTRPGTASALPADDPTRPWHAEPDTDQGGGPGGGPPRPTGGGEDGAPPPDPTATRRRRLLAPVVTGVLLLWAGIASLAGVDVDDALAIGLCIVGVGFVLGAFVGGSRALVVPAFLIAGALLMTAVIDVPLSGGIGERGWTPASIADLDERYHLGIGEGILDLRAVAPAPGETVEVEASVGVGHLVVHVPSGVTVVLTGDASAGEIVFLGHSVDGLGVRQEHTEDGHARSGTIELELAVGVGQIEVVERPPVASARRAA